MVIEFNEKQIKSVHARLISLTQADSLFQQANANLIAEKKAFLDLVNFNSTEDNLTDFKEAVIDGNNLFIE